MSSNKKEDRSAAKSLRWLANNFPYIDKPEDNTDRITNAIHVYATAGAEEIESLKKRIEELEAEKSKYDYVNAVEEVIDMCLKEGRGTVKRVDSFGDVALWLEAEWVALNDSPYEVIELMICYSDTGRAAYSRYIEETKREKVKENDVFRK